MKYKITDIINFIDTASCASIMQASLKIGISQPALSESLKRLESDLGHKLFYRSRTGIKLTPSGSLYLDKAKIALQALDDLQKNEQSKTIFDKRRIKIGCHPLVAQYSLPQAFKKLHETAPDFNFEIIHGPSREIQYEIQKGNIDLGIVINPSPVPDIIIFKLERDRVGLWQSPSYSSNETIYCDQNLFQTHAILKKIKFLPKKIISTSSLELIVQMTKNRLGLGIIPERVVKLYAPNLVLIDDSPVYTDEICLVYRPEFGKITAEKLTLEAIKTVFNKLKN